MRDTLKSFALAGLLSAIFVVPASANEPTTTQPVAIAKTTLAPHCQVPCGIYTDQLRFEQMLEDTKTIAKSIASVDQLAQAMQGGQLTPTNLNQSIRWVQTKEDHASKIQKTIAEYFLTQRIKDSSKDYASQLMAAHKVMVSAMKCKQDAKAETAETLKNAIYDLYRAYEGKEPNFEHDKKQ